MPFGVLLGTPCLLTRTWHLLPLGQQTHGTSTALHGLRGPALAIGPHSARTCGPPAHRPPAPAQVG